MPSDLSNRTRRLLDDHEFEIALSIQDRQRDVVGLAGQEEIDAASGDAEVGNLQRVDPLGQHRVRERHPPDAASMRSPRHACSSRRPAPAAHACGAHATG